MELESHHLRMMYSSLFLHLSDAKDRKNLRKYSYICIVNTYRVIEFNYTTS
jgi:hypothetical protein